MIAERSLPFLLDADLFQEFADALHDIAPQIERNIGLLKRHPDDGSVVSTLFRLLHNLKGDAAMCRLDLAVRVVHPLESLLSRVRNGEICFSEGIAEVVLLALDRLELAIEALTNNTTLESLRLPLLIEGLERVAHAVSGQLETVAEEVMASVTGFRPSPQINILPVNTPSVPSNGMMSADLTFFRQLATQLETRSPFFRGRNARLLRLALATNEAAGNVVDSLQLTTAVYLHDVGMMFLPEHVWLKVGSLSTEEKQYLERHPEWGAGLLERMAGWEDAAAMILQHHEKADGSGYPHGLHDAEIVDGAKILAIVDAFEAVTLKQRHRGYNRSLLRAIAEINACQNQFSPHWIQAFNSVIRHLVEA